MKKSFAIIGLGRFGGSICRTLSNEGLEVLAIDRDEERVNEYAMIASHAVVGGADRVVHPERDMGRRIANNMISGNIVDYLELSAEHSIFEIVANGKISGYTIIDLDIRKKYGLNIVAIKRGNEIIVSPQAKETLCLHDVLIVIGNDSDISRFERKVME